MSVILLSGVPGSGKSTLAENLKMKIDQAGMDCVIVHEPSVEDGAFSSSKAETLARSDFKAAVQRELSNKRIVIADGMNFIKGFRYELFCFAREAGLGWCVAFCDVDDETARIRSLERYKDEKRLIHLIGRMERPSERNKWDCPLFLVKDPNDPEIIQRIFDQCHSKSSKLIPKKATSGITTAANVNDQIDQKINEFCSELVRIQSTVPIGSRVTICGAVFEIKRIFNPGQLKRARREFASRARGLSDNENITQVFADGLSLIY